MARQNVDVSHNPVAEAAGLDLLAPYLDKRNASLQCVVIPLQERKENVSVLFGQGQATAVSKKFPYKKGDRPRFALVLSIRSMLVLTYAKTTENSNP